MAAPRTSQEHSLSRQHNYIPSSITTAASNLSPDQPRTLAHVRSPLSPPPPLPSSTSTDSPASPSRVKGTRGDKDFDTVKAVATRYALLEQARVEAARARRDEPPTLHAKGMPLSASGSPFPTTNGTPPPRLQAVAPPPVAMRMEDGGQRSASADSTTSLARSASQSYAQVPVEDPAAVDIPALIAAAGTPEAAIERLLHEKHSAAQNNAQLWRLLDKQRAVMADLNKDFQKAIKDRDRYRRRFKDQLATSESLYALHSPGTRSALLNGDSTTVPDAAEPITVTLQDQQGMPADMLSPPYTAPLHLASPMYNTPMPAPFSDASREKQAPARTEVPAHCLPSGSPAIEERKTKAALELAQPPQVRAPSGSPNQPGHSFSAYPRDANAQSVRRAPPAPLKLNSQLSRSAEDTGSSSEYGDDSSGISSTVQPRSVDAGDATKHSLRTSKQEQGAIRDNRHQQRSLQTQTPVAQPRPSMDAISPVDSDGYSAPDSPGSPHVAAIQTYQSLNVLPGGLKTPVGESAQVSLSTSLPLSGSTPGQSASPQPRQPFTNAETGSAPANMPMLSRERPTISATRPTHDPLSAPTKAVPSASVPHLTRLESGMEANPSVEKSGAIKTHRIVPAAATMPELTASVTELPSGSSRTPGDIYRGFMTDRFPDMLLPPPALGSVIVKVDSSRLRPSRHSYMSPKQSEENPVFSLGIYSRSDSTQLWRVEKTLGALAQLDSQLKSSGNVKLRLPDKALFTGHSPARIDARRHALTTYLDTLLEAKIDEKATNIVCSFLSSDAIGAEAQDYFQPAHLTAKAIDSHGHSKTRSRKDGYLTKKGKNFGGWKARYFVLDGPTLKYFEAPGGAMLGAIRLQDATIGRQTGHAQDEVDEENQFRHAFLVLEPKKKDKSSHVKHVLCAESDEERDVWVQCLMQYVEEVDPPRPATSKSAKDKPLISSREKHSTPNSPRLHKSMSDMRRPDPVVAASSAESQSQLRAIMYDHTLAAEAPQLGLKLASPSPTASYTDSQHDSSDKSQSVSHPPISGPTNGSKIQDAGIWGNKSERNVLRKKDEERRPDKEKEKDKEREKEREKDREKEQDKDKERKRSIFAFKGRPSMEARDGTAHPPLTDRSRGVFGVPLAELVEAPGYSDTFAGLPSVVYRSLELFYARNAALEQGIFRMSGSNIVIKALKERFETEGDVNFLAPGEKEYDVHAIASLLKLYLRELPSSILTRELHLDFIHCIELEEQTKLDAFNMLINRLPGPNRELLCKVTAFLKVIVDNEKVNKMNVRNVGIVFAPTLNIPAPMISLFVTDHGSIFGKPVDPATIRDRLPHLLSSPTAATHSATAPDFRTTKRTLFPDLSRSAGMTPQQLKEQFDVGYSAPGSGRPPLKSGYSADQHPKPAQGLQRSLSSASLPRHGSSRPPSRDRWNMHSSAGLRHASAESSAQQHDTSIESEYPSRAPQHTSFGSMHFPDPPMSARLPPPLVSPLPATLAAARSGSIPYSAASASSLGSARSPASSTSTLTTGASFPAGFQRDSHASVSQPMGAPPLNGAPYRDSTPRAGHWSKTEASSASADSYSPRTAASDDASSASRMNSVAAPAPSAHAPTASSHDATSKISRNASVASSRSASEQQRDWLSAGPGYKKGAPPRLLDIDISSSPFMGLDDSSGVLAMHSAGGGRTMGSSGGAGGAFSSSYGGPPSAMLQSSSFSAGITPPPSWGFGAGGLAAGSGSHVGAYQLVNGASSPGAGLPSSVSQPLAPSGHAATPTRALHSSSGGGAGMMHSSVSSPGTAPGSPINADESRGGLEQQHDTAGGGGGGFGRRLLRRQSAKYLVKAGVVDERGKPINTTTSRSASAGTGGGGGGNSAPKSPLVSSLTGAFGQGYLPHQQQQQHRGGH